MDGMDYVLDCPGCGKDHGSQAEALECCRSKIPKLNTDLARKDEALRGADELFGNYGFADESPCVRDREIVRNIQKALSPSSTWLAERDRKQDAEALERIAAFCHSQWSGWMEYLFSKTESLAGAGGVLLPSWAVKRWTRQMKTPYADLDEKEKESDRKEARGFFAALRGVVPKKQEDASA